MPRLFTALEIPRDAALSLSLLRGGLPGARWIDVENYHITLRFIGDIEGHVADEIANALDRVRRPSFSAGAVRRRRLRLEEAAFGLGRRRRLARPHRAAGRDRAHLPAPRRSRRSAQIHAACHAGAVAQLEPDRCRALSFGARQFLGHAVQGRALRADVVARFGRRRPLRHRGGLAAWRRRIRQPSLSAERSRSFADHAVDFGKPIRARHNRDPARRLGLAVERIEEQNAHGSSRGRRPCALRSSEFDRSMPKMRSKR